MLTIIFAIAVLLVFSAFFSGSETALTAASPPLMHQMEKNGNRHAALVNRLHANKERLISAILLGNNLVNILASALATSVLITAFGDAGIAYATIAMTLLILIFAEIMPKSYAFTHANRAALAVAPAVQMMITVLMPATRAIEFVVGGLLRVTGIDSRVDDALETAAEELRGAIELHDGDDRAIKHERAMLRSVLDLSEVQVGEIMVHRRNVVAFDADQPVEAIVAQVLESPFTRIPLWRDKPDNIVGVLHAKALLRAVRARDGDLDDLYILEPAAEPWFIPESTRLLDQLHTFRQRHEHFALVVDEYGGLMGVVTLEDILEEIVGDISDEHDIAVTGVRPQPDGSYMVEGSVTIRDLNREFEWDLPDEEAATIAGLILHESRRIPDVGQLFRFHRFRFEIVRRQRHQITLVRVTPPKPDDEVEPESEAEI